MHACGIMDVVQGGEGEPTWPTIHGKDGVSLLGWAPAQASQVSPRQTVSSSQMLNARNLHDSCMRHLWLHTSSVQCQDTSAKAQHTSDLKSLQGWT